MPHTEHLATSRPATAKSNPGGARRGPDDATTKNPVEALKPPATPGPWREYFIAQVRSGRDRFHILVGAQVGRGGAGRLSRRCLRWLSWLNVTASRRAEGVRLLAPRGDEPIRDVGVPGDEVCEGLVASTRPRR